MISINSYKTFKYTKIKSCASFYLGQITFRNVSPTYPELQLLASRKNAKKEKNARNRIAARRFSYDKKSKNVPSSEYNDKLTNYVSPFKYSAEEAESEAAKIPRR